MWRSGSILIGDSPNVWCAGTRVVVVVVIMMLRCMYVNRVHSAWWVSTASRPWVGVATTTGGKRAAAERTWEEHLQGTFVHLTDLSVSAIIALSFYLETTVINRPLKQEFMSLVSLVSVSMNWWMQHITLSNTVIVRPVLSPFCSCYVFWLMAFCSYFLFSGSVNSSSIIQDFSPAY